MKKLIFTFLFSGVIFCASAADLVTKSGVVLKEFALAGAAPNGIYVFHSKGVAVVPVKEFPDSMKAQVARIAKDIPAAKRREAARLRARKAREAAQIKRNRAEAARLKKSAALVKKEQDIEKKNRAAIRAKKTTVKFKGGK